MDLKINIELEIGDKILQITEEQAKELQKKLNMLFPNPVFIPMTQPVPMDIPYGRPVVTSSNN